VSVSDDALLFREADQLAGCAIDENVDSHRAPGRDANTDARVKVSPFG